jgi:hypothetical protein
MFLSAYHFDGDPGALVPAYDAFARTFPPEALELHACVVTTRGITVYDACPTREVFEEFHRSAGFRSAVAAAGLPLPRIEPLGEVHRAVTGRAVAR